MVKNVIAGGCIALVATSVLIAMDIANATLFRESRIDLRIFALTFAATWLFATVLLSLLRRRRYR